MPPDPEPEPDLRWTAFLYATGDLAPAEASRFEDRLDVDQAARDAVADAVEIAGAIAAVAPEFRRARRPVARRALAGALATAAAAGLILAIVPSLRAPSPTPADASGSELALAWSSLRDVDDPTPPVAPLAEPTPQVEAEAEAEEDHSADRALPSWLLSAASAALGDSPREED